MMFPAVCAAAEVLAAVFQPTDRSVQLHRQPAGADLFAQQLAFEAEPATDIRSNNTHLAMIQPETTGDPGADDMGDLRRRVNRQHFKMAVPHGDNAPAFDRRHALARGLEGAFDHGGCTRLRRLEIDVHGTFEEDVFIPLVMHHWRIRIAGLCHIMHCRQFLEINRHQFTEILCTGPGFGEARNDWLADVPDLRRSKNRLNRTTKAGQSGIRLDPADTHEILCRKNTLRGISRFFDPVDPRMCKRAAQKGKLEHPLHADIANESAAAMQIAFVLLTKKRATDAFSGQFTFYICIHRYFPS